VRHALKIGQRTDLGLYFFLFDNIHVVFPSAPSQIAFYCPGSLPSLCVAHWELVLVMSGLVHVLIFQQTLRLPIENVPVLFRPSRAV